MLFNEKIKKLRAQGEIIHHLGFGQCPFPIPDVAVHECQKQAWRSTYCPTTGIPALRQAIVDFHRKTDSLAHFTEQERSKIFQFDRINYPT